VNLIYFLSGAAVAILGVATWLHRRKPSPREGAQAAYIRGLNHLLRSEDSQAQEWLTRAVRQDTQNVDAYLKLAEIFRRRGDLARALRVERELLVRSRLGRAEREEILASLAFSYETQGDWSKAAETLRKLVELDGQKVSYQRALTRALECGGLWDEALETRRQAAKLEGEPAEKELALVIAWTAGRRFAEGKEKDGRRLLREAFRLDADCPAALLLQGDRAAVGGRLDEATRSWRQLAEKRREWGELAFRRLEQAYYEQGAFERMPEFFQELLREDPLNVGARLHLARLYHRKGEPEEAIRVCREGLALERREEDSRRLESFLVSVLREMGRYREALAEIDRAGGLAAPRGSAYRCKACAAAETEFDWRCTRCGAWGTMRSVGVRAEEVSRRLPAEGRRYA